MINYKRSIYALGLLSVLVLQGCGGGSGGGSGDGKGGSKGGDGKGGSKGGDGTVFKYNRISLAGSSITWGNGHLGEKSYVGEVVKYFREDVADTVGAYDALSGEVVAEPMSYGGKLYKYDAGSQITGNLKKSDKISMVFAVKDGVGAATVEMIVDGVSKGEYTISAGEKLPVVRIADVSNERDDGGVAIEFIQPFRENNKDTVKTWSVEDKAHSFTLKVKSGTLLLNYVTNHMYYFQNAGVGGYAANDFLRAADGISTVQEIVDFNPDLFMFESSTNDANFNDNPPSTNAWVQKGVQFVVEADNKIKLVNATSNIEVGNVVVMGNYSNNKDINDIEVGIVQSWDSSSKIVTFTKNMNNPARLVKFCQIKSITAWENNVKEVISKVVAGNANVEIGIGTSGVPNLLERKLMGYREKGQMMATEKGWMFFDFFKATLAVESGIDKASDDANGNLQPAKWSNDDNTHPNTAGWGIFGKAIVDVLKAN